MCTDVLIDSVIVSVITHHRLSQDQSHSLTQSWTDPRAHGCSCASGLFSPVSHTQILQGGHLPIARKLNYKVTSQQSGSQTEWPRDSECSWAQKTVNCQFIQRSSFFPNRKNVSILSHLTGFVSYNHMVSIMYTQKAQQMQYAPCFVTQDLSAADGLRVCCVHACRCAPVIWHHAVNYRERTAELTNFRRI